MKPLKGNKKIDFLFEKGKRLSSSFLRIKKLIFFLKKGKGFPLPFCAVFF